MKASLNTTTKIALALALAAVASIGCVSQAQEKPIPPPEPPPAAQAAPPVAAPVAEEAVVQASVLPSNIAPDSSVAQVVKLVQAGVEIGVINNFIANTTSRFNLDAETVITLNDAGVPPAVINSMLDHDKKMQTVAVAPAPAPAPAPAAVAVAATETAPPTEPVTVNYFYQTLSPYGAWVEVDGYGRCWRPTVVTYDVNWRPYCDRGRWVYTDCGWYWDSDYSWGSTFHYGRWFRHARWGWCWYPDTVWGPSWVTFRSHNDYYGWAPLPPRAVFRPGVGFFYRDAHVAIGFDFGLDADCFTFISRDRFCDRRPRDYCAPRDRVRNVFNNTTVINNYGNNNTIVVNNGIAVEQVNRGRNRPIEPVRVGSLPNAGRQGWRGDDHRDNRPQIGDRGDRNDNNAGRNRPDADRQAGGRPQVNNGGDNNRSRDGQAGQPPQNNNNQAGRGPANGGANARQGSSQQSETPRSNENNNRGNREGRGNGERSQSSGNNQPMIISGHPAPATAPGSITPRNGNANPAAGQNNSRNNESRGNLRNESENQNRTRDSRSESHTPVSTASPSLRDTTPRLNPSATVTPPSVSRPASSERQIQREPVQQRSTPVVSERSVNPGESRRSQNQPVISAPMSRPLQVEPRQIAAPVQREQVERRVESRSSVAPVQGHQPPERRVEQRSEPAVRSTPSAPAASQSRSSDNNSSRSSNRDSERRSNKDK